MFGLHAPLNSFHKTNTVSRFPLIGLLIDKHTAQHLCRHMCGHNCTYTNTRAHTHTSTHTHTHPQTHRNTFIQLVLQSNSPQLALYPLGQIMSHLYGEVLTIQRLHLVQSISLELLGLDPHCHLQHPEVDLKKKKKGGLLLYRAQRTQLK